LAGLIAAAVAPMPLFGILKSAPNVVVDITNIIRKTNPKIHFVNFSMTALLEDIKA
jgi:hypothetical protein